MKRFVLCVLAGLLGALTSAAAPARSDASASCPADLLASYHFAGADSWAGQTNANRLKGLVALPATRDFFEPVLQRLSWAPDAFFPQTPGSSQKLHNLLVRPLMADLWEAESCGQWVGRGTDPGSVVLAIRLSPERAKAWQSNLWTMALDWTGKPPAAVKKGKVAGWEAVGRAPAQTVRLAQAGGWLLVAAGAEARNLAEAWLAQIEKAGRPRPKLDDSWLDVTWDGPRLRARGISGLPLLKPARTDLSVAFSGGSLRTTAKMVFDKAPAWRPQPWKVPVDLVRDPLVSFTAFQNVAPFVEDTQLARWLGVNPLTNQVYGWARSQIPFQTFAAMPVAGVTNLLRDIVSRLPQINAEWGLKAPNDWSSDASNPLEVSWKGLAMIVPLLRGASAQGAEYLTAEIFPQEPSRRPPPPELLAQFNARQDVLYYDWELSTERLGQWMVLSQALPFYPAGEFKSDAGRRQIWMETKWLNVMAPAMGNTTTEATVKASNEVHVVRKSILGFTGFELVRLAHWLNTPEFTLFGQRLGPAPGPAASPAPRRPVTPPPIKP